MLCLSRKGGGPIMPPHCAHAQKVGAGLCLCAPLQASWEMRGGDCTLEAKLASSLMGAFTPSPSFSDFAGTQKKCISGQSPKIASLASHWPLWSRTHNCISSPQSALHTVGPKWTEFQTAWSSLSCWESQCSNPQPWHCHLQKNASGA